MRIERASNRSLSIYTPRRSLQGKFMLSIVKVVKLQIYNPGNLIYQLFAINFILQSMIARNHFLKTIGN